MEKAQKSMKKQFDKKRQNLQELKVGENVWLENKNIQLNKPLKKLYQKRYGLFKILKNIGSRVFQLELPEGSFHSVTIMTSKIIFYCLVTYFLNFIARS